MIYHLDWAACTIALMATYIVGKKKWWGWILHAVNLIVLTWINIYFKLWGFMPMNAVLLYLYYKNARDWYRC